MSFGVGVRFRASWDFVTLRVHVPNNLVLGLWVMMIIIEVLGKYVNIRYLDP